MLISHKLVFNFSLCENKFMEIKKLDRLDEFLKAKRGRASALAKRLGISDSYLSQIVSGLRPMPVELCPDAEKFTKGAVSRVDCRPDDGHRIWPELKEASHA